MKIGIFGAGAIGCYVGGRLALAGEDVVFVGRAALGERLAAGGLRLSDQHGFQATISPSELRFRTQAAALADRDLVIVTVKSLATFEAGDELRSALSPDVTIVSLQNGVRNADRLRERLPKRPVLGAMVPFNVAQTPDGRFHQGTRGPLVVERAGAASDALVAAFERAKLEAKTHPNIAGVLWGKLLFNLNNAVNALSGLPLREQLLDPGYRRILSGAIIEGLRATQKGGIEPVSHGRMIPAFAARALLLPTWLFSRIAKVMVAVDAEARSSMADDLERRRRTEIDDLNGEIVRLGGEQSVPVPINLRIVELIKEAEEGKNGSPRLSPSEIMRL